MQVFSEPEMQQGNNSSITQDPISQISDRDSYEISHVEDNTYATIQPRNLSHLGEISDYATLRNSRAPSVS